ncbi:hypothetical protein GCM10011591_25170 [Nocardia camponoti]|uniref:Secreted protein n=2 Tax=Nocardia camponoti TaxID=1616106 RepID=A0A917QJP3_9NOCA|nr:hypothetical protein GCM10011591_25170 [Nocardia camponoti]
MWFGLAAIALVGAVVLLYFDRVQRQRTGHARQVWAKSQGYTYVSVEPALASTWRRGALAKLGYLSAVDVVSGIRKGEKFVLFDLEDAATLVAVRRQIGSEIDIDMRLKTAAPPKDHDLELLGAIGDRVVFATDTEVARHAVDQRMVGFIEGLSDNVQMLWSEGNWTLGMLGGGSNAKDWEAAIDAVLRLSGLLHVLPPVTENESRSAATESGDSADSAEFDDIEFRPQSDFAAGRIPTPRRGDLHDPSRFTGPDDEDVEDLAVARIEADTRRGGFSERDFKMRGTDGLPDDFDPDLDDPDYVEPIPEPRRRAEPSRRPSLAVVPEPRPRVEPTRPRPVAAQEAEDSSDSTEAPGGPFHPGFRPYQGPVPK